MFLQMRDISVKGSIKDSILAKLPGSVTRMSSTDQHKGLLDTDEPITEYNSDDNFTTVEMSGIV